MRLEKDGIFEWILHIEDHFSKYSFLRPLTGKGAGLVARELEYWIQLMGPPRIVQCGNGHEFKGAVLHLLDRYGVVLINSNPRHPQRQGLIEQENSVVERKLRALMAERGTKAWSTLLVEVSMAINSEIHSTLRLTPYEIVFNQHMRTDNPIRTHCNCQTACNTKRCGCYKMERKCSIHCHPRGVGNFNCCNIGDGDSEIGDSEMME